MRGCPRITPMSPRPLTRCTPTRATAIATGALFGTLGLTAYAVPAPAFAGSPQLDRAHHYGRSLFATDGVAAADVWAVGLTPGDRAAIRHWDGTQWSLAAHPKSAGSSVFRDVSARTSDDAWAVGSQDADGSGLQTVYSQRWDGTRWRTVGADPGLLMSEANGVDARTADDAWIVGDGLRTGAGALVTVIEHWDGAAWQSVPAAKVGAGCDASLHGVTSVAADDVWAAGSLVCDGTSSSLVEHWNGQRWSRVAVPSPRGSTFSAITDITAIAADDAWAIGASSKGQGPGRTMTLHWDGSNWSIVSSPNPGAASCDHTLQGVSASGSSDVWAAGSRSCSSGVTPEVLHWDGSGWSAVPIPPSGFDTPPGDGLFGIVALSKSNAVTVGIAKTRGPSVEAGFIEHWNGTSWSLD